MTQIEITGVSGATYPLNIYACDVYQNQCVLIATLYLNPVSTIIITLPPQFDSSPAVGILIRDNNGCEKFEIGYCGSSGYFKQFQDYDDFLFMDYVIYQWEGV
jgi:hypothetical protein